MGSVQQMTVSLPCHPRICRVRLKGLSEDTDITILGENIVQKCGDLIPDEWLPKVSDCLGWKFARCSFYSQGIGHCAGSNATMTGASSIARIT